MIVLSSTSSSDSLAPDPHWRRAWLLTAALLLILLGGYELYWRSLGFVPMVNDDADLWSLARSRVRADDPNEIVLIGGSRLQLGLDPELFARSFTDRKPIQLAVDGSSCVPVLDHFSRDEHFRGLLICEVSHFFFSGLDLTAGKQAEYVHHYQQRSASAFIEESLRSWIQSHLVLRLSDVSLKRLPGHLIHGKSLKPNYIVTLPGRSRRADYSQSDLPGLQRYREEKSRAAEFGAPPAQLQHDLDTLEEMVRRIQSRGGRVVFLVMPTSGVVRQIEQEHVPREKYWDRLVAHTQAMTIHFANYTSLQFECPEGSHLDYREAREFTRHFASILRSELAAPH
jgi:hypothetical protein